VNAVRSWSVPGGPAQTNNQGGLPNGFRAHKVQTAERELEDRERLARMGGRSFYEFKEE
jgi:hypothetical protein